LVPFEHEKIIEFSRVKANERITISGYVKWINNKSFALVPTLFSNQIHLLCVNNTERRPTENSYITVSGTTRWAGLNRLQIDGTLYKGHVIVEVDGWKNAKTDFRIPKAVLDFGDFKRNLTSRILSGFPFIVFLPSAVRVERRMYVGIHSTTKQ